MKQDLPVKFVLLALLFSAPLLSAQDEGPPCKPSRGEPSAQLPASTQMRKLDDEMNLKLEQLEKISPELAQKQRKALKRRAQIAKILAQWRKKDLTDGEAEKELTPLVAEDLKPQVEGLQKTIGCMEKRIAFLRRAEKEPALLTQRRVKMLLGQHDEPDMMCGPSQD